MPENESSLTIEKSGIRIDGLCKTYKGGKVKALNELSVSIEAGEAFGIIGPNGAGKTTLFGCLLSFLRPDKGTITIDGMPPDALEVRKLVGYLPERLNFDKWMTGREFMHFHHELSGLPRDVRLSRCDELLTRVGLDPTSWTRPIKKYSRGMLQRLGFAQALVGNPKYLLLDEPASGVDPAGVLLLRRLLKELKSSGVTIILNSHQLDQVEKTCDRVAFIQQGKVNGIENLQAGPAHDTRFLVRWTGFESQIHVDLSALFARHGANLIESQPEYCIFVPSGIDTIASILKEMLTEGYAIIQLTPEENRLERYFDGESKKSPEDKSG